jgi:hypothetical protein
VTLALALTATLTPPQISRVLESTMAKSAHCTAWCRAPIAVCRSARQGVVFPAPPKLNGHKDSICCAAEFFPGHRQGGAQQ